MMPAEMTDLERAALKLWEGEGTRGRFLVMIQDEETTNEWSVHLNTDCVFDAKAAATDVAHKNGKAFRCFVDGCFEL